MKIHTVYSVNDVPGKDPWERPLGKTPPKGVYRGLRGVSKAFVTWKDPSDPCKPPWGGGAFPWDIIDGPNANCLRIVGLVVAYFVLKHSYLVFKKSSKDSVFRFLFLKLLSKSK